MSNVENLCFSAAGYSVVLQLKKAIRYIVQEFCEASKEREENMSDVQGTFLWDQEQLKSILTHPRSESFIKEFSSQTL